jgi:Protein of unknown function (DUF3025)
MKQILEWNREVLLRSPLFAPLHPVLAELESDNFPALEACNALLAARHPPVTVQCGMQLRFVAQQSGRLPFELQYEPRCYLTGEVPTRADNLHDLFNALVWLTFPKTKSILNARHYHALMEEIASGTAGRGAVRDVNTLLDETGVIVVYADEDLAGLLRSFRWKELFWQRREQVMSQSSKQNMGFCLFGHGLYEKALRPYVGMTGQGLLIKVDQEFFSWPAVLQLMHLDSKLSSYLAMPEHCRNTRDLSPVPLLGVPEWAADNVQESYYDNTEYFRSGRRA